jgi:hypothetical protein
MQYPKANPASKKPLAAQVGPSLVYHIGCSLQSPEGYGYRWSSSHGNWHPGLRDGVGTGTLGNAADDELFLPWYKHAIDPLYTEAALSIAFQ